jgi:hypothetical protein
MLADCADKANPPASPGMLHCGNKATFRPLEQGYSHYEKPAIIVTPGSEPATATWPRCYFLAETAKNSRCISIQTQLLFARVK